MSRRKKSPIGPFGCILTILFFPFAVIFELVKKYK